MFKNKTLLISGGTGSFGNAVLEKFSNFDQNSLIFNSFIDKNFKNEKK